MNTATTQPPSDPTEDQQPQPLPGKAHRFIAGIGDPAVRGVTYLGGLSLMLSQTARWVGRAMVHRDVRLGWAALHAQIGRLGIRSIGVIALVSSCIGLILALQMAPPLAQFGQTAKVANIIAVAIFRELGPLISAIVITGFAGASIAAELGTMVVGEEIEALQAHALNPIRFLVVPRVLATILAMLVLTVMGELVAVTSGYLVGVALLDIPSGIYISNSLTQLQLSDFLTGMWKAGVFGLILSAIACYNGLAVTGGAAGVGKATTNTVVHSVVAIIFADLIFTAMFYSLGWN
jgi:phospholipid/cholesterol/gamma-HCH transport system permease protein